MLLNFDGYGPWSFFLYFKLLQTMPCTHINGNCLVCLQGTSLSSTVSNPDIFFTTKNEWVCFREARNWIFVIWCFLFKTASQWQANKIMPSQRIYLTNWMISTGRNSIWVEKFFILRYSYLFCSLHSYIHVYTVFKPPYRINLIKVMIVWFTIFQFLYFNTICIIAIFWKQIFLYFQNVISWYANLRNFQYKQIVVSCWRGCGMM